MAKNQTVQNSENTLFSRFLHAFFHPKQPNLNQKILTRIQLVKIARFARSERLNTVKMSKSQLLYLKPLASLAQHHRTSSLRSLLHFIFSFFKFKTMQFKYCFSFAPPLSFTQRKKKFSLNFHSFSLIFHSFFELFPKIPWLQQRSILPIHCHMVGKWVSARGSNFEKKP